MTKVHQAAKRAGFKFCQSRCSFIAWTVDAAHAFVTGLQQLGYTAQHGGRWPSGPPAEA